MSFVFLTGLIFFLFMCFFFFKFFFFKQKTAYEIMPSLVGSEMCIRDSVPADAGHPVEFLPEGEDVFQCDPAGFQRNVTDGKGRAAVFRPGTFLWEYIPGRRISRDRKTLAPWRQFRVHAAAFIYACLLYTSPSPRD